MRNKSLELKTEGHVGYNVDAKYSLKHKQKAMDAFQVDKQKNPFE